MSARLRLTILGCGSSGGVPRLGGPDGAGDWGVCDPSEPKNRRTRCSLLVERTEAADGWPDDAVTRVLIDTAPDLREQLLAARVGALDAVFYSHDHADQSHGVDDLRVLALRMGRRVPVHMDPVTAAVMTKRFAYCFVQAPGSLYPPILDARVDLEAGQPVIVEGAGGPLSVVPLLQDHGPIDSLGFRFGPAAYSNDVVNLPKETLAALEGLDLWIVDALRYTPHKTHAHLAKTLGWIEQLQPARAVLTNLHVDMDYAALNAQTPAHVEPAYDGQRFELTLKDAQAQATQNIS